MQIYYQYNQSAMLLSTHSTNLSYRPHFQPSLELIYIYQGHSTALVDEQEYRLGPDDLLIVFPHQIHGYRDDDADLDRLMLIIPLDHIPAFKELLCSRLPACPILHNASRFPCLIELFTHIHKALRADSPYAADILRGYLTAFLGQVLTQLTLEPINDIAFNAVHSILSYCSAHYREPLTMGRLADELHLHRSYLSSVFSRQLHISFNDYINALRIEDACHMLRSTNNTMTAIAATVGFETTRTFNRAFQRSHGMTPSEYRKHK